VRCCIKILAVPALLAVLLTWCGLLLKTNAQTENGQPKPSERASRRVPWTTSRIKGSPEPPHPYKIERAFAKLTFKNPLLLTMPPGGKRFFVGEQAGKIYSFPNDPECSKADLSLDVAKDLEGWDKAKVRGLDALYGLVFHPQFDKNRYCYVCYVLNSKTGRPLPDGSRVSRFRVTDTDPPRCDPKSEKIIITWLAGGHNGGDLHFGNDGFLYISTGDGTSPNPPDALDTGQDISDLLSSILRIDVDREEDGKSYAIPPDNPFVKTPRARPEVWAYGFRNPWRMSFDRPTGDLWVGDVGWELWEMIYRVKRGGNYGWSVMEGPQAVRPDSKRGPTPILPPNISFPHTEAASITGGFVYRGKRLKDLAGVYICGDWVTKKLWGTRFNGDNIVWHKELAQGTQRVVAFGVDQDEELYFLHHDDNGTIHRLIPNEAAKDDRPTFPRRLSETGLFASVKEHLPAPGVYPFRINAELWADYASSERFVALPGTSTAKMYDRFVPMRDGGFFSGQVYLPEGGVLVKTLSLEMEAGNPRTRRRLETQILHFEDKAWNAYSYAWNDDGTDATLVPAAGMDRVLTVKDAQAPGGKRRQTWHFHSRAQCLTCHNPWAGYALAFNPLQLNGGQDLGAAPKMQCQALADLGLVSFLKADGNGKGLAALPKEHLANPADAKASLAERARSYLHVNCSHCHQFGAGGTALIDLRYTLPLKETKTLDVAPVQGAFDIVPPRIIAPGDPYGSTLYYRMAKLGPGRMPHIGSDIVDEGGLRLVHDWIEQLAPGKEAPALAEKRHSFDLLLAKQAGPDKAQAADAITPLLSSTSSALMLARAVATGRVPDGARPALIKAAMKANPQVRDLFERFVPDDQRVQRLGNLIRPEQILTLKGNVDRGRELFFKSGALQCANCHRAHGTGSTLGPDLSDIGKKYTRVQILESILQPSKFIDPKYTTYLVETNDGKVYTGLLATKTEREVVLRTAQDKEVRLPVSAVAAVAPQATSLMPEMLLRDVTAAEAADLIDYLGSLK
jgi:putative heme-binding domain-containing protein